MKQELIIEEHKYIQKFFINLCCHGIVFIFILAFIYGKYYESVNETFKFLLFIFIIELIGLIGYYFLRKVSKKRYIFGNICVNKYKEENLLYTINYCDIIKIYYVRIRWMLLLQFGAGYLIIKYKNELKEEKKFHMSMSLNDVKELSKRLSIEIK